MNSDPKIALQREGVFADGDLIGPPRTTKDGARIDFEALVPELRARVTSTNDDFYLLVDPTLPMGELTNLVARAHGAGFGQFLMGTTSPNDATGQVHTGLGLERPLSPGEVPKIPVFEMLLHVTRSRYRAQRGDGQQRLGDKVQIERDARGRSKLQTLAKKWIREWAEDGTGTLWAVISVEPDLPVQTFVDAYEDVHGPDCTVDKFRAFSPNQISDCWFVSVALCTHRACAPEDD